MIEPNGSEPASELMCPSAGAESGSVVFAVRVGDAEVAYLDELVPASAQLLQLAEPADPRQVFRFGAPCAEHGCQHFTGTSCSLGERIATRLDPAVNRLPACRLRNRCRWYAEQGGAACLRCPVVVTLRTAANEEFAETARPPS
jgi:hypothetical protein